jgi:S1-C subfamily serine protease
MLRVGLLSLRKSPQAFLGTAFTFRSGQHLLTAAHVVGDLKADELIVTFPTEGGFVVESVEKHPTADVALLTLTADVGGLEAFGLVARGHALADQFIAFGYPEGALDAAEAQPTPRAFVGHYQRFFNFTDYQGYKYFAAEMSIPAPTGLSGGPLFSTHTDDYIFAVVANNFDSATLVDQVVDIDADGTRRSTRHERIVTYGIAVMVKPLEEMA